MSAFGGTLVIGIPANGVQVEPKWSRHRIGPAGMIGRDAVACQLSGCWSWLHSMQSGEVRMVELAAIVEKPGIHHCGNALDNLPG
jgi:hypothetical protein